VGGVLGRLAMRLLAVTSGQSAQGGVTDDQAIVGEVTLRGTVTLALICTGLGALGGLIYLCVRRVLPDCLRGRILGYGLFSGAIGGALFVHEHGSFDYTVHAPAWLAVAMTSHPTCRSTRSKHGCCVSSCQAGLWPTSIYLLRASPVVHGTSRLPRDATGDGTAGDE
jgi:hypothetical protein